MASVLNYPDNNHSGLVLLMFLVFVQQYKCLIDNIIAN
jgi:hypothetical protein